MAFRGISFTQSHHVNVQIHSGKMGKMSSTTERVMFPPLFWMHSAFRAWLEAVHASLTATKALCDIFVHRLFPCFVLVGAFMMGGDGKKATPIQSVSSRARKRVKMGRNVGVRSGRLPRDAFECPPEERPLPFITPWNGEWKTATVVPT